MQTTSEADTSVAPSRDPEVPTEHGEGTGIPPGESVDSRRRKLDLRVPDRSTLTDAIQGLQSRAERPPIPVALSFAFGFAIAFLVWWRRS